MSRKLNDAFPNEFFIRSAANEIQASRALAEHQPTFVIIDLALAIIPRQFLVPAGEQSTQLKDVTLPVIADGHSPRERSLAQKLGASIYLQRNDPAENIRSMLMWTMALDDDENEETESLAAG